MHQLEEAQETHHHDDGTHLCEAEAHHHCSLCDTLLIEAFSTTPDYSSHAIVWCNDYKAPLTVQINSSHTQVKRGRAPPQV